MQEMTDAHRLFLQFFMSKGLLNASEVKKLYHYICEKFEQHGGDDQLAGFVLTINDHIKPMHLEIKKGICEETEGHYYGLVNSAENEITLSSSDYTVSELEFFKKIVDRIVTDEGSISSTEAVNLVHEVEKMSKKQAEDVLDRMVKEKWLMKTVGRYSLSVRSVLELEHYIEEQYPDSAVKCNICKKLVIKGQSCSECDVKLHLYCARRWMQNKENLTCPEKKCGVPWPHVIPPKQTKQAQPEASNGTAASQAEATTSSSRKRSARH